MRGSYSGPTEVASTGGTGGGRGRMTDRGPVWDRTLGPEGEVGSESGCGGEGRDSLSDSLRSIRPGDGLSATVSEP